MKVTNTERMSQLASCVESNAFVIIAYLKRTHPEILNESVSRISKRTVNDILEDIRKLSVTIGGGGEDAKYYYADIDLPYSQDDFPVEHR